MKYPLLTIVGLCALMTACQSLNHSKSSDSVTKLRSSRIALVLGGGGAKGFAHIGVIDALHAHGIRPDLIVGTSSGAMVGAVYAAGKSPQELKQIALSLDDRDLIDVTPSKQGLLSGDKLRALINRHTNNTPIERLPTRFVAVATEMPSGSMTIFDRGETGLVVQASAAVPKLFIAPRIPEGRGKKYADGGQSALVPARVAKSMGANIIISVDVLTNSQQHATQLGDSKPDPVTNQVHIVRKDNVITGRIGKQQVSFDLGRISDQLNQQIKEVNTSQSTAQTDDQPTDNPFAAVLGRIVSHIPEQVSLDLPTNLPTDKKSFWQLIDSYAPTATMHPTDIAASSIIIRPDLSAYSVFNSSERAAMIAMGQQATLAVMPQIHALIDAHGKSAQTQVTHRTQPSPSP